MAGKTMVRGVAAVLMMAALGTVGSSAWGAEGAPVKITEDAAMYTLDNGIVTVRVAKVSGDLLSVRYKDMEMLATFTDDKGMPDLQKDPPGANPNGLNRGMTDHQYGFWSHDAMGPRGSSPAESKVTIDPASNGGERGEVSIKGSSKGKMMGTGPGANPNGQFASDIEIRYTLGRGDSGVYTYCMFEHQPDYPTSSLGEARFCAKLNSFFDWLSAGEKYNKPYPKEQEKGEDKYVYTTVQSLAPAFGWSSSTKNVGFYCINPSMEYMSGGPTKPEFLGHRDTNAVAAACVLNYWRSSHYGGAVVDVAQGEHWDKVIGPFFLYVNSGASPEAMYADAKAQAGKQAAAWPFDWVKGVDYPGKEGRTTVKGQIVLRDPGASGPMHNLQVGLTHAAWRSPMGGRGGGPGRTIDWQQDAKFYQFWARGGEDGTFTIADIRPGTYTLRAFADGVLGELAKADVTVEAGKPLDVGKVEWRPVRHGKQVWEIGVPNRNASEFFMADAYTQLDVPLQYAKKFPNDITYEVGKSDFRKDWFYMQVPHNVDPEARAVPFSGIRGKDGNPTPYAVAFDMAGTPKGKATLRLAICGGGARSLAVSVNGAPAGQLTGLIGDGVITRHQIQGIWYEREVAFDAALLKAGRNVLTLTVPGGSVNNGLLYDYLRLELDENAQ
jgi:rhamnogalacturonan endolyase